jgi:hypothetical protein
MGVNVTARAQTADALEQAARTLKRHIRESRELLGVVRRAQVGLIGIEVETVNTQTPGGHGGTSQNTAEVV